LYVLALTAGYDRTTAHDGKANEAIYNALKLFKQTEWRLLVTGRELQKPITNSMRVKAPSGFARRSYAAPPVPRSL
jgi:hypothetical protein